MYWFGKIVIALLGICWVAAGSISLFNPCGTKRYLVRLKGVNFHILAWLPLISGIFIYLSSYLSSLEWFLKVIGILGILKGLFLLFVQVKTTRTFLNWWIELPDGFYRIYGVLVLGLGGLVIYSVF